MNKIDENVEQPTPQEVRIARSLAQHVAEFGGPDLRHMSDAELVSHLKKATNKMADAFAKTGVSISEADVAFNRLAEAANKVPNIEVNGGAAATLETKK